MFMKNKYNILLIESPIMGNFKQNVGYENGCYTNEWKIIDNEYFKWIISEDGNEIHCLCIQDNYEETTLSLETFFLYDSEITLNCNNIFSNITWKLNVFDKNNKKKYENIDNDINFKIKKNDTLIFTINISNCCKNTCVFIIKDLKCMTNLNTTLKVPFNSMLSLISTQIKFELKNMK